MAGNMQKRIEELEERSSSANRTRVCWKDLEPDDLRPGDTLHVVSWMDEDEDKQ